MEKQNRRARPLVDEKYRFAGDIDERSLGPVMVDETACVEHGNAVPFALNNGLKLSSDESIDSLVRLGKTERYSTDGRRWQDLSRSVRIVETAPDKPSSNERSLDHQTL